MSKYKIVSDLDLYILDENPLITFVVTDKLFSVSFHFESGSRDFSRALITTERPAIKFGRDLFEHYKQRAEKI